MQRPVAYAISEDPADESGPRKHTLHAGMIVMKMRDDDVANGGGIDAKGAQSFHRMLQ